MLNRANERKKTKRVRDPKNRTSNRSTRKKEKETPH